MFSVLSLTSSEEGDISIPAGDFTGYLSNSSISAVSLAWFSEEVRHIYLHSVSYAPKTFKLVG